MYENKNAIAEATQFIDANYAGKATYQDDEISKNGYPIAWLTKANNWVSLRLDYERDFGVGTPDQQREWFEFLLSAARDSKVGGTQSLSKCILVKWASKSKNVLATAYHEGHTDGNTNGGFYATKRANKRLENPISSDLRRAANGKRLIGATTRANEMRKFRAAFGLEGALAKLASDPKQKDKVLVRECWTDWQKQPERYKGKAAFARDMREKFPNLESQPVIEGWCRQWERQI